MGAVFGLIGLSLVCVGFWSTLIYQAAKVNFDVVALYASQSSQIIASLALMSSILLYKVIKKRLK